MISIQIIRIKLGKVIKTKIRKKVMRKKNLELNLKKMQYLPRKR